MPTVEIRCQTSPTQPATDGFLVEVLAEKVTLGELITRTVQEQIRMSEAREADRMRERARQFKAFRRQYLTEADIAERAGDGKVSLKPKSEPVEKPIDAEEEIRRALSAFERKQYIVLVNGRQAESLKEELVFEDQTRVTFVRLMPLAGG